MTGTTSPIFGILDWSSIVFVPAFIHPGTSEFIAAGAGGILGQAGTQKRAKYQEKH